MNFPFAVNQIKANMAHERVQRAIANRRLLNPKEEIPDATEEEIQAEYVKMGGLLANQASVEELKEREKHNDFVKKSKASEKLQQIVDSVPKKEKKSKE